MWGRQTLTMRGLCWQLQGRRTWRHWHPSFRRVRSQMSMTEMYDDMNRRERGFKEEREEEVGGEMGERESLAHFLFSSWMLTFFSGWCKFFSPSCLWMRCWHVKAGAFVCRVWRTSALESEREKRREREQKKEGEREREEGERGRWRGVLSLFYFTFPSFQAKVRFSSNLFLDAQWWRVNTIIFLFSLSQSFSFSLFLQLTLTLQCTLSFPLSLFPSLPLSLSLPSISVCFAFSLCLIMWCLTYFSVGKCFFHWRPPRVLREWNKAEKWRKWREKIEKEKVGWKIIDKRERESEREGYERKRSEWEGEIFHFHIFFLPSDTPSLGHPQRVGGVCERAHRSRSWRGSQKCKEWDMWEFLLFTVCLGVCGHKFRAR